jgi:hypothetical protein
MPARKLAARLESPRGLGLGQPGDGDLGVGGDWPTLPPGRRCQETLGEHQRPAQLAMLCRPF